MAEAAMQRFLAEQGLDDDEQLYGQGEKGAEAPPGQASPQQPPVEEEDSDEDVEIIMDGPGRRPAHAGPEPKKTSLQLINKPQPAKTAPATAGVAKPADGGAQPAAAPQQAAPAPSKVDINAMGMYEGQPIIDIDPDLLDDKPWRRPGADLSDYFNYGFNEDTWRAYCQKQKLMMEQIAGGKFDPAAAPGPEQYALEGQEYGEYYPPAPYPEDQYFWGPPPPDMMGPPPPGFRGYPPMMRGGMMPPPMMRGGMMGGRGGYGERQGRPVVHVEERQTEKGKSTPTNEEGSKEGSSRRDRDRSRDRSRDRRRRSRSRSEEDDRDRERRRRKRSRSREESSRSSKRRHDEDKEKKDKDKDREKDKEKDKEKEKEKEKEEDAQ